MQKPSRRGFLGGVAALVAMPYVVRAATIYRPEVYGGGPEIADNAPAFQTMASAIRSSGGRALIELLDNAVYQVCPNNLPQGYYTLFDLIGTRGVVFNGNGAKITSPMNFNANGPVSVTACRFYNSFDYVINDLWLEQSAFNVRGQGFGFSGIVNQDKVQNGTVNRLRMLGGQYGFMCVRNTPLANVDKARNFQINGMQLDNVYYGINCQKGGDQLRANGVYTRGVGRVYFIYNVNAHEVDVFSDANAALQDVLIGVSHSPTDGLEHNATTGIDLKYTVVQAGAAPSAYVGMGFGGDGASEGRSILRDVSLRLNIKNYANNTSTPVLVVYNACLTPQQRMLENIVVSGSYHCNSSNSGQAFALFRDKNWSGDRVRNFNLRDFVIASEGATQSVEVDGRGLTGAFVLDNVNGGAGTSFVASNMASQYVSYRQSWLPGLITP